MKKSHKYFVTLLFLIISCIARAQDEGCHSDWSEWHNVYTFAHDIDFQVSFKYILPNKDCIESYYRFNNPVVHKNAYLQFKFDYKRTDGTIGTETFTHVDLNKTGVLEDNTANWYMGAEVIRIYAVVYKDPERDKAQLLEADANSAIKNYDADYSDAMAVASKIQDPQKRAALQQGLALNRSAFLNYKQLAQQQLSDKDGDALYQTVQSLKNQANAVRSLDIDANISARNIPPSGVTSSPKLSNTATMGVRGQVVTPRTQSYATNANNPLLAKQVAFQKIADSYMAAAKSAPDDITKALYLNLAKINAIASGNKAQVAFIQQQQQHQFLLSTAQLTSQANSLLHNQQYSNYNQLQNLYGANVANQAFKNNVTSQYRQYPQAESMASTASFAKAAASKLYNWGKEQLIEKAKEEPLDLAKDKAQERALGQLFDDPKTAESVGAVIDFGADVIDGTNPYWYVVKGVFKTTNTATEDIDMPSEGDKMKMQYLQSHAEYLPPPGSDDDETMESRYDYVMKKQLVEAIMDQQGLTEEQAQWRVDNQGKPLPEDMLKSDEDNAGQGDTPSTENNTTPAATDVATTPTDTGNPANDNAAPATATDNTTSAATDVATTPADAGSPTTDNTTPAATEVATTPADTGSPTNDNTTPATTDVATTPADAATTPADTGSPANDNAVPATATDNTTPAATDVATTPSDTGSPATDSTTPAATDVATTPADAGSPATDSTTPAATDVATTPADAGSPATDSTTPAATDVATTPAVESAPAQADNSVATQGSTPIDNSPAVESTPPQMDNNVTTLPAAAPADITPAPEQETSTTENTTPAVESTSDNSSSYQTDNTSTDQSTSTDNSTADQSTSNNNSAEDADAQKLLQTVQEAQTELNSNPSDAQLEDLSNKLNSSLSTLENDAKADESSSSDSSTGSETTPDDSSATMPETPPDDSGSSPDPAPDSGGGDDGGN